MGDGWGIGYRPTRQSLHLSPNLGTIFWQLIEPWWVGEEELVGKSCM